MSASLNNTGIKVGKFYKVPRGHELPFATRWLKCIGHSAGAVNFRAASGKVVTLWNAGAELLAKHATAVRDTTPPGFL